MSLSFGPLGAAPSAEMAGSPVAVRESRPQDQYAIFQDLEGLRRLLTSIKERQVKALSDYHDKTSNGFFHLYEREAQKEGDYSKASTATCVASLVATGEWETQDWSIDSKKLASTMLKEKWESAGLRRDNPFTTAFIIESVYKLVGDDPSFTSDPEHARLLEKGDRLLIRSLRKGLVQIPPYPPSTFLTQLVVRVLKTRGILQKEVARRVEGAAWQEIARQVALSDAKSKNADLFQLAYAIILVASLQETGRITPDQGLMQRAALDRFFAGQLEDGTWPRSRPLLHYPKVGSAYCYEYELLTQLVSEDALKDALLRYLPHLGKAAHALQETAFELRGGGWGWSSGHHPQIEGPESWSTASAYHYVHALDRLVAEAIRRTLFAYFNTVFPAPQAPKQKFEDFGPDLLDSEVTHPQPGLLRRTLYDHFVVPIAASAQAVAAGRSLPKSVPMSAIFFGPPGTSKTQLSKRISQYLGWPLLSIDPSHLVRNGLDQVQAEADRLFNMLDATERVVVLLDEFDEMVRDRSHAEDVLSRFLTTAMLPKLVSINEKRRLVFIVATNYLDKFDLAISRRGRFDMLIQVMPPSVESKLDFKYEDKRTLREMFSDLGFEVRDEQYAQLKDLTFDELRQFVAKVEDAKNVQDVLHILDEAHKVCTLSAKIDPNDQNTRDETWSGACARQAEKSRLP